MNGSRVAEGDSCRTCVETSLSATPPPPPREATSPGNEKEKPGEVGTPGRTVTEAQGKGGGYEAGTRLVSHDSCHTRQNGNRSGGGGEPPSPTEAGLGGGSEGGGPRQNGERSGGWGLRGPAHARGTFWRVSRGIIHQWWTTTHSEPERRGKGREKGRESRSR